MSPLFGVQFGRSLWFYYQDFDKEAIYDVFMAHFCVFREGGGVIVSEFRELNFYGPWGPCFCKPVYIFSTIPNSISVLFISYLFVFDLQFGRFYANLKIMDVVKTTIVSYIQGRQETFEKNLNGP